MRPGSRPPIAIAVAVIALVTLASCGDDADPEAGTAPAATEPAAAEPAAAEPAGTEPADTDTAATYTSDTEATATEPAATETSEQRFPDVVGATATRSGDEWTFAVTISSPYDTPQRYADAWRVLDPDGAELGVRLLAHDHQNEQPFTRSLNGVVIPDDVDTVTIEGRDQVHGWGGEVFVLTLERT